MPTLNKALHFGAGRIGRALVGSILRLSGYQTTFVDVSRSLVEALNKHRQFPLAIIGPEDETSLIIDDVSGLHFDDIEEIELAFAQADLVSTSVGPLQLPAIAPRIAGGLRRRFSQDNGASINIIPFENTYNNGDLLRGLVFSHLTEEERTRFAPLVGFPNTTITSTAFDVKHSDPTGLLAGIDRPQEREIVAEKSGFVAPVPVLEGIILTHQMPRFEDRKMFTAGAHAIGAFLGHLRGHTVYSEAMQETDIKTHLVKTMDELSLILQDMHGFSAEEMQVYFEPLIWRFIDLRFSDPITRVARDPKRKLAAQERIVTPARYAHEKGLPCTYLLQGIAAGLKYDHPDDKEARELKASFEQQGFEKTLLEVTGIDPATDLGRRVRDYWNN